MVLKRTYKYYSSSPEKDLLKASAVVLLLTCGNDFLICGNELSKMQRKQFYVPSWAP